MSQASFPDKSHQGPTELPAEVPNANDPFAEGWDQPALRREIVRLFAELLASRWIAEIASSTSGRNGPRDHEM